MVRFKELTPALRDDVSGFLPLDSPRKTSAGHRAVGHMAGSNTRVPPLTPLLPDLPWCLSENSPGVQVFFLVPGFLRRATCRVVPAGTL